MKMGSSGAPDSPKTVVWNSQGSKIAILVDDHAWIANPLTGEIIGSLIHGYSVEKFNGYSLELGEVKGESPILSLMKPIAGKYVGDDKYLFTRARSDGNEFVFVWETATGKFVQRFLGGKAGVDVSPDGERVAANGTEWNVKSGNVISRAGQDQDVTPSFDPSGSKLAYVKQKEIRLFDALDGREIRTIVDDQSVRKLVWTPDGQYLAAVGSNVVHIWSVADGRLEISLEFPKFVVSFAFSSTENAAIGAMSEGSILKRLWRPQELEHEVCRRLIRNLTTDEWEKFFGSEPYKESCPGLSNTKLRERTHRI